MFMLILQYSKFSDQDKKGKRKRKARIAKIKKEKLGPFLACRKYFVKLQ